MPIQAEELSTGMALLARCVVGLGWLGIGALVVIFAAMVVWDGALELALADISRDACSSPLGGGVRGAIWAIAAVYFAPPLWGLWHIAALFRALVTGAIFAPGAARHLRRIGQAAALVGKVARPAVSVVLSISAQAWQGGALSVSVGLGEFATRLFGGMLIVLGAVMGDVACIA